MPRTPLARRAGGAAKRSRRASSWLPLRGPGVPGGSRKESVRWRRFSSAPTPSLAPRSGARLRGRRSGLWLRGGAIDFSWSYTRLPHRNSEADKQAPCGVCVCVCRCVVVCVGVGVCLSSQGQKPAGPDPLPAAGCRAAASALLAASCWFGVGGKAPACCSGFNFRCTSSANRVPRFPFFFKLHPLRASPSSLFFKRPLSPSPSIPIFSGALPAGSTPRADPLGRGACKLLRCPEERPPQSHGSAGGLAAPAGAVAASPPPRRESPRRSGTVRHPPGPAPLRPARPGPAPGGRRGKMDGGRFPHRHTPWSSNINEYGTVLGERGWREPPRSCGLKACV